MEGEPVCIIALGASTAVGRDAWSSAAAVRAGISGFSQHPYMIDTAGEPMRVACAPWLDIDLSGVERFEALLYPAIDQALEHFSSADEVSLRVALSLGLPCPRPGLSANLRPTLMRALGGRYKQVFSSAAVFSKGHAAGLLALDAAVTRIAQGVFDACVIAGVDSYVEPETLEWLEECDQLHGAGPLNNAWGFIPGEGAGTLLLVPNRIAERLRVTPLAQILGLGTAFEVKQIKTKTVCIGEGLTRAFDKALTALPDDAKVSDIYCDINGEPYRSDEYGFTCLRTKEAFEAACNFVAPADCWGDVSAASGPLSIAIATISGIKGYAKGSYAMAWNSSESGERAATVLKLSRSS